MADTLTKTERSLRMSLIKGTNSRPEMIVRRLVHAMGFRYRLHVRTLAGVPDLVFPRPRKIVLVHGCFWHRHGEPSCKLARLPKSRVAFWTLKLNANRTRDRKNRDLLERDGWKVLEIWECEIKDLCALEARLRYFLEDELT
jgi:DNA mismatch endonuclease (patch repair protein)